MDWSPLEPWAGLTWPLGLLCLQGQPLALDLGLKCGRVSLFFFSFFLSLLQRHQN